MIHWEKVTARSAYFMVWSWNIIYAIIAAIGLIPEIVIPVWQEALINAAPWSMAVFALLIIGFPLCYLVLALTWFRRDPMALLKLFYGVEVPIFFLLLCRIILFRDMNPGLIHLLVNIFAAFLIYFLLVWRRHLCRHAGTSSGLASVGAAVIPLLVGLYLAGLMLPFVIPLGALFAQGLWEGLLSLEWLEVLKHIFTEPLGVLGVLLMVYTATLFLALPFVSVCLYVKSFLDEWRGAVTASGVLKTVIVVLCIVLLDIGLFVKFFDTPIEKAERARIAHAAEVTWQREQAAAGLLNTLSEFVLITEQQVTVAPQGDGARITISQTLENQTFRQHEVLFHFSLPQEAALTGLWLSDDPDLPKKYAYVASPRGAAQQVYNTEVRRRVDPSLLEQVGPRQYRLRAFPVPARIHDYQGRGGWRLSRRSFTVKPLYLRFEYQTVCDDNGNWPLPDLLEKRNVYWNESTRRVVNDREMTGIVNDWLPSVTTDKAVERRTRRINLDGTLVSAVPRASEASAPALSVNNDQPLAVIVDGSYSMTSQDDQVARSLARLREQDVSYELFFCHNECRAIAGDAADRVYYGNSQTLQQLAAWQTMTNPASFRAVIVLTDAGSYELASEAEFTSGTLPPLWLVHLGDKLPYAYHDQLLALLRQSRGGIARTMDQAVASLSFWEERQGEDQSLFAITEHYSWYVEPGAASGSPTAGDAGAFQHIAARQWLDYQARVEDTRTLPVLDRLHGLAKQYHLVTDYSSMIVLVNDAQRQALEEAEAKDDRFAREVETGSENLSKPSEMFTVSAVPEPREMVLLGMVGMLLVGAYARRRYMTNTV